MSDSHAFQVREFLAAPSTYAERPEFVEIRETHISWVYLAGRVAYKQKKPVKFEFLDFSSLEDRHVMCQQELMLNQRFSPEVYRDIVPVCRDATGHYQVGNHHGDLRGTVVEWLLKMVRLDDHDTLEQIIGRGELTPQHTERLASSLAQLFTKLAPLVMRSDDFVAAMRHHVKANGVAISGRFPQWNANAQYAVNSQSRCLCLEEEQFANRVCDGRVVDGHGDLRPEHIYFRRMEPTLIDCVEFSREYRTNDVLDELAFLAMECERLHDPEVGETVLRRYMEQSKDTPPHFLAPFYKSYRACVRAKVAALRSEQIAEPLRAPEQQLASDYIDLAVHHAWELGSRLIIIVSGLMGSGKSTLATYLQQVVAAELLHSDIIRKEFYPTTDDEAYGHGPYAPTARDHVYETMLGRIAACMAVSPTVVLDASFGFVRHRLQVCEIASDLGAKVLQLHCHCAADVAKSRIAQRIATGHDASDARPELYELQQREQEPLLEHVPHLTVDTTLPTYALWDQVKPVIRQIVAC